MTTLKVPKYPERESSFELEEMINPTTRRRNHTCVKPDYGPLKEALSKGKVKK